MAKERAADASCQSCCWQSICIRSEGAAGCLFIVAAFVFGWVPSARERESRLLAIAEVGLRRLRRLHVRARGGPRPHAYSFAPLESQPAVLACAVDHGRGAADGVPRRRCRKWLGTQRRPGERGGHGDVLAPTKENFSIGTAFQKEGGYGYVETVTHKCSNCFATYPYPPPMVELYQRSILCWGCGVVE